jgi:site-specific DNA-methyltransferase (adenine-specific)
MQKLNKSFTQQFSQHQQHHQHHHHTKTEISESILVHADCFDVFPFIEDNSIDAIICDLPYGTTNGKWDSILDLDKLWVQYKRIIKENGVIVLFAQTPFDKVLGCSNLEWLKYEWIWEKTQATGYFNAKKMPMKAHENILVFYKNLPTFNPQKTEGHKPINSYTKKAEVCNKTEVYGKVNEDFSGGGETIRYPRSVQVFASDKQKTKLDGTIHPTQKPLALLEMLVKSYTNEGDLVLDNTMGSGTCGLASIKNNRNFIGIEKEKKYFDVSVKRVSSYLNENKLF